MFGLNNVTYNDDLTVLNEEGVKIPLVKYRRNLTLSFSLRWKNSSLTPSADRPAQSADRPAQSAVLNG